MGTKFKLNDTNRFVISTSIASAFCTNGGSARLSSLSNRVCGSITRATFAWKYDRIIEIATICSNDFQLAHTYVATVIFAFHANGEQLHNEQSLFEISWHSNRENQWLRTQRECLYRKCWKIDVLFKHKHLYFIDYHLYIHDRTRAILVRVSYFDTSPRRHVKFQWKRSRTQTNTGDWARSTYTASLKHIHMYYIYVCSLHHWNCVLGLNYLRYR